METYTGYIIRESLKDERLLKNFDVAEERTLATSGWHMIHIHIPSPYVSYVIPSIQYELNEEGRWYARLTNGAEQIIVYAQKVFRFKAWDRLTLRAARDYGARLGIAPQHLIFLS